MAIVSVPTGMGIADTVFCIVCEHNIALGEATAGFRDANNAQAFACNEHFRSSGQYIMGWVDFVASERKAVIYSEAYISDFNNGGPSFAWSLY